MDLVRKMTLPLIIATLASCKDAKEAGVKSKNTPAKTTAPTNTSTAPTGSPNYVISASSAAAPIIGTWETVCLAESDGRYSKRTSIFDQKTDTMMMTLYSDSTCQTVLYKASLVAKYSLSKNRSHNMDLIITAFTMKLYDVDSTHLFNSKKICGRSNWSNTSASSGDDGGIDVSTCKELNTYAPSNRFYSIYAREGNALYFGDTKTNKGKTEEARPTSLDRKLVYTLLLK